MSAAGGPWDDSELPLPLLELDRTFEGFLELEWLELTRSSAKVRGHDQRECLWTHEFRDDADRLCALVDVTIAVRPRPPAAASV